MFSLPRARRGRALLALRTAFFLLAGVNFACGKGAAPGFPPSKLVRYAYVANAKDNTISAYGIGVTGQLSPLSIPSYPTTGVYPVAMAAAEPTNYNGGLNGQPARQFLYVANRQSNNLSAFEILQDGRLTPLNPPTVPTGNGPSALALNFYNNEGLFVTNSGDNTVSSYTIHSDGTLTLVKTYPTGKAPSAVLQAFTQDTPDRNTLYVANKGDNTISQFLIQNDGTLTPVVPATVPTVTQPIAFAFPTDGINYDMRVTVLGSGGTGPGMLASYAIKRDGGLLPAHTAIVAGIGSGGIGASGDTSPETGGSTLAVPNTADNTVSLYFYRLTVGSASGQIVPAATPKVTVGSMPSAAAFNSVSLGSALYVTNAGDNTISQFSVAKGGVVTPLGTTAVGTGQYPVAITAVDLHVPSGDATYHTIIH